MHWRKVEAADDRDAYVHRILINTFRSSRRQRRWRAEHPTDDQILGLLERATSDTEVGPAPVQSILRNATRTRRRRRGAMAATLCVGTVVGVVAAAGASQLTKG